MDDRLPEKLTEGTPLQEARFGDWDQAAQALALMPPAHLERFLAALVSHWVDAERQPAELIRLLERAAVNALEIEPTPG